MSEPHRRTSALPLTGLDGSNMLAFMAAVGTLRVVAAQKPNSSVRLHWKSAGSWLPVLTTTEDLDQESLVSSLEGPLRAMANHPALAIDKNLKLPPDVFRQYAQQAVVDGYNRGDRTWPDFVAAFGCDALHNDGVIRDTAFRTMSGAGHQNFLETMRLLAEKTTGDDLRRSLFEPWDYSDERPSLRWDPADERRYALRWKEPSGDPIHTMRGANRLAIEALPLFPTAPVGASLETTGFRTGGSRDTFFSWPIWKTPADVELVRSLVAMGELQRDRPDRKSLGAMGIVDVYRAQRLTIGKFRNFAPAYPV